MGQPVSYSLRLAVRSLLRARGATLLAMLTLGIALAATVALLGVIDSGARSLPVPGGADVVELEAYNARAERVPAPAPIEEWATGPGVLEAGALQQIAATLSLPNGPAARARGAAMHPAVLELLRVQPTLGRLPTTDAADADAVVLGWDVWQSLGANAQLIGTRLDIDGRPHTIAGVMPEGFGFPERHSFWTVLPERETGEVVARLAPGAREDDVARNTATRLSAAVAARGGADGPHRVVLEPWTRSREAGGEGVALAALGGLVFLLLLVCCANVATLLLVRGNERATQLAVHAALGASRGRVTLQLFLESVVIAIGGGVLGLAGGFTMLRWMQLNLAQHWGYYWMEMEVRTPVLAGTVVLVMLAALLAGTAPSLRASRVNLARELVGQRGGSDPRQRRLGRWFVGGQVMLSALGLIAAVYLAWGFRALDSMTAQLPVDRVVVAEITLPAGRYQDAASRAALARELRAELERIPGVARASITSSIPGALAGGATIGQPGADPSTPPVQVSWIAADPLMTDVYRMRLLAGRSFTDADDGAAVVVVTRAFARQHFDGSAVGRQIRIAGVHGDDVWAEIVGVVEDWFPDRPDRVTNRVFVPLAQGWSETMYISLATLGDAGSAVGGVRGAVARVDAQLPVAQLETLEARMQYYVRMPRVIAGFGVLGGVASALVAAIGLYGVMSFQVRMRRREIGIRMAVGAAKGRIMREILRESTVRVAPGLALGVAGPLLAAPLLSRNAPSYADAPPLLVVSIIVAAMLLLIGIVAALQPALRAARLDPQEVLRAD